MSARFTINIDYIHEEVHLQQEDVNATGRVELPTLPVALNAIPAGEARPGYRLSVPALPCRAAAFERAYLGVTSPLDVNARVTGGAVLTDQSVHFRSLEHIHNSSPTNSNERNRATNSSFPSHSHTSRECEPHISLVITTPPQARCCPLSFKSGHVRLEMAGFRACMTSYD